VIREEKERKILIPRGIPKLLVLKDSHNCIEAKGKDATQPLNIAPPRKEKRSESDRPMEVPIII
jgi:hypothetical protein